MVVVKCLVVLPQPLLSHEPDPLLGEPPPEHPLKALGRRFRHVLHRIAGVGHIVHGLGQRKLALLPGIKIPKKRGINGGRHPEAGDDRRTGGRERESEGKGRVSREKKEKKKEKWGGEWGRGEIARAKRGTNGEGDM